MNWEIMFPGKYLKSAEMQGKDVTLTIKSVVLDDLPEEKGGTRKRGVVAFNETPKLVVLNRTNGTCLAKMFGPETNGWHGKRVTFFPAPFTDPFTGEVGTAIRVRGSPELKAPIEFSAKIGRKQVPMKLVRTGAVRKAAPAPVEPPPFEEDFGGEEPPADYALPIPGQGVGL